MDGRQMAGTQDDSNWCSRVATADARPRPGRASPAFGALPSCRCSSAVCTVQCFPPRSGCCSVHATSTDLPIPCEARADPALTGVARRTLRRSSMKILPTRLPAPLYAELDLAQPVFRRRSQARGQRGERWRQCLRQHRRDARGRHREPCPGHRRLGSRPARSLHAAWRWVHDAEVGRYRAPRRHFPQSAARRLARKS